MKKKKELLRVFQTSDRLLAILIDPDKVNFSKLENLIEHLPKATTHLFVGGSTVEENLTEKLVRQLKAKTPLPFVKQIGVFVFQYY